MSTALFALPAEKRKHPAKYTDALLVTFARMLKGRQYILDPFAGTGKVFLLNRWLPNAYIEGVEIEPEWAAQHPRTTLGNALHLPWPDGYFDAICTSPCLAHGHRILRRDLRWIPVEDIHVGDELIAFDEFGVALKSNGQRKTRKWRIATVLRSVAKPVECVRVHLSNDDSIVCTPEHPWLAQRYRTGGNSTVGHIRWVQTKDLLGSDTYRRRAHGKWMDIPKKPTGWWVHKQLDVWEADRSYEAGWLAGMFDGEGSLAFGVHGAPKLMITQVKGPTFDSVQQRVREVGIEYSVLDRTGTPEHRQPMANLYVLGGFPSILKTLGRVRPERLIAKLDRLDIASRNVAKCQKIQVVAIEPAGIQMIQEIETSTGTYIGEGYLMHNCYGNRMADKLLRDPYKRKTYASELARELHPDNGGALPWGRKYRAFHLAAWTEARRVLEPGGLFVLNIKDHIRRGVVQPVTDWHIEALEGLGFRVFEHVFIDCPGMRFGQNRDARVGYESVILFQG